VVPVSTETAQRLLNVDEAARFLHRSRNSIYIACRAGTIPHYKIGNSTRFSLDELKAWLQENRRGPMVGTAATDG
jgi:excisionase family DNA binding protein